MTTTNIEVGASPARPNSLTASSLLQRAGLGLLILGLGTFLAVWLFDASIKAGATDQSGIVRNSAPAGAES